MADQAGTADAAHVVPYEDALVCSRLEEPRVGNANQEKHDASNHVGKREPGTRLTVSWRT